MHENFGVTDKIANIIYGQSKHNQFIIDEETKKPMIAPKALKLLQQFNIIKKFVISFKDDKKQVNVKEIMLVVQELLQKQKIYEVQIRHKISKD